MLVNLVAGKDILLEYEPDIYELLDLDGNGMMGYVTIEKIGQELPLYHGTMTLNVIDYPGTYTETMSLMKNTNTIRILLHEMSGHDVDADKFIFEINDSNGLYDWDNTLLSDELITYSAWHQSTGSADMEGRRAVPYKKK